MAVREMKPGIYSVGAIDWDRTLFDALIPLPQGTSYNAYIVKGSEKVALIDTVDPSKEEELIHNLRSLGLERIDFVVANHAEQDHSGAIPAVLKGYPEAKVVCTPKCKEILIDLMPSLKEENFLTVGDNQTLSLGQRTLRFLHMPWVHWPETMVTYLEEDRLLFPCDLFGSHLATSDLYAADEVAVYSAAKRYYAEIMMPFRRLIKNYIPKVRELGVEMIAPSHGPIYDKPEFILSAYEDWTSDVPKKEVLLLHVSMHGSTKKMVEHLIDALIQRGVAVKVFDLTREDLGELAMSLVDPATLILASPTVLTTPHPAMLYAVHLSSALRPKVRFAGVIGSYSWGGRMVEIIKEILAPLKVEFLEPVLAKGYPKKEDLRALEELAEKILQRHNQV